MLEDIKETKEMREILSLIRFNSIIFFDLDTLLESQIELGSSEWFIHLRKHVLDHALASQNLSKDEIEKQVNAVVLSIYQEVQKIIKVQPVEASSAKIIYYLQSVGLPILGITSRDSSLQAATLRQLWSIGVDLSKIPLQSKRISISAEKGNNEAILYDNGIIYCVGKDKGTCLKAFILNLVDTWENLETGAAFILQGFGGREFFPAIRHVLMIDDDVGDLKEVRQAILSLGLSFSGVHYTRLDEKNAIFDLT